MLSRFRFEEMIRPMLGHTADLCREALREAGLKAGDLDMAVPVGGQTRTPAVMNAIREIFSQEPIRSVNPDEVVAVGAAIQTGILQGEVLDLVLLDVTPHTLGIETREGSFTPIIERNSNIPKKKSRNFTTVVDNQPSVDVHVLQGEGSVAEENVSLARFQLGRLDPVPAGEPEIEVTFEMDVNGILQVTALDHGTGRQQNVTVRASSGLTQSEVQKFRSEQDRLSRSDELRTWIRLNGQLRGLIQSSRKTLELLRGKLTKSEQSLAERTIRESEAVVESSPEEMRAALSRLESVAAMLGQAIMRDSMPPEADPDEPEAD